MDDCQQAFAISLCVTGVKLTPLTVDRGVTFQLVRVDNNKLYKQQYQRFFTNSFYFGFYR